MKALNDNIIVKQIVEEVSEKIFVPPQFIRKMQLISEGEVISAGPGDGMTMSMPVAPGNIVLYGKNSGYEITFKGDRYRVIKLHNMICAR